VVMMASATLTGKTMTDADADRAADGGLARPSPPEPLSRRIAIPWQRLGQLLFAALLIGFLPWVLYRTCYVDHGSDFPRFWESGRYVIEHAARKPNSEFIRYWPSLDVAAAGLAWMPILSAGFVWWLVGAGSWVGLLATTKRRLLTDCDPILASEATLATGLLVMPLVLDHMCLGSFHLLMVWLMVAGLARCSRGKNLSGGILLGLAIWIKLLPIVGAGYLVVKRKWAPALIAILVALGLNALLSVVGYGPRAAWELNKTWWHNEAVGTSHRLLANVDVVDEDRLSNESPAVVMRRLLTHQGFEFHEARRQVALAALTPAQLETAYTVVIGLLAAGILFYCRRPGRELSSGRWATEIALVVLSTLWMSPVMWSYHPTAAAPALTIVLSRKSTHPVLAWSAAFGWLASMALLAFPVARCVGVQLWMTVFLGIALVGTLKGDAFEGRSVRGQESLAGG
jgi:hypothetical protein